MTLNLMYAAVEKRYKKDLRDADRARSELRRLIGLAERETGLARHEAFDRAGEHEFQTHGEVEIVDAELTRLEDELGLDDNGLTDAERAEVTAQLGRICTGGPGGNWEQHKELVAEIKARRHVPRDTSRYCSVCKRSNEGSHSSSCGGPDQEWLTREQLIARGGQPR